MAAHSANNIGIPESCWSTVDTSACVDAVVVSRLVGHMAVPPTAAFVNLQFTQPAEASVVWYTALTHAVDYLLRCVRDHIPDTSGEAQARFESFSAVLQAMQNNLHLDGLLSCRTASHVAWHISDYTPHLQMK